MLRLPDSASPGNFLVLALPRSRTKWLSEFLTYGPWQCSHEAARHFRSMGDITSWAHMPFSGSAETAVGEFWRVIPTLVPPVRVVVVRRPIEEVVKSLMGVMANPPSERNLNSRLAKLDAKLTQLTRRLPGVVSVTFSELATREGAKKVFEHSLKLPFDEAWWQLLAGVNIQAPFALFERYVAAYAKQMRLMAELAQGAILGDLARGAKRSEVGSVTFTEEPFGKFLAEGTALFAEHSHAVGELGGSFATKNLEFLQAISDAGAMQILVARSNGRMFGYLMCEISPSREAPGRIMAVETTFFASRDFPGLGMKLQRETIRRLFAKGISEVWFRSGDRGDGPRLDAMYKRLGAQPSGAIWRLNRPEAAHEAEGTL